MTREPTSSTACPHHRRAPSRHRRRAAAHPERRATHMSHDVGHQLPPLLANVIPDEVDKELEKRGHAFARYADDCNVYVSSQRAGERVMEALRGLYAGLRLRINEAKSAVARPQDRKFLGYSF